ncbi:MAG: inorganic phosphate transporter, partial [Limisphaerales bacterium]
MELTAFHYFLGFIALFMLIYNTIEVGRNDAANIVNAVFGAKVLDAKRAILLAGLAVIVGAVAAAPVMETARKGIFDPSSLGNLQSAINVYLAVYVT